MTKKREDQTLPVNVENDNEPSSSITYANEVIAIIAGLAASEVEGVAGMVNVNTSLKGKNKNMLKLKKNLNIKKKLQTFGDPLHKHI